MGTKYSYPDAIMTRPDQAGGFGQCFNWKGAWTPLFIYGKALSITELRAALPASG
jgi:hypothetical protein